MMKSLLVARAIAGGKARGWQERKEALQRYNARPHYCRQCSEKLLVGDKRVADVIKKKFCNNSCAAKYNNKHFPNRYKKAVSDLTQHSTAS